MNYFERLTAEITSKKNQLNTLREVGADYAADIIEEEIQRLNQELERYQTYEAVKLHHIYNRVDN